MSAYAQNIHNIKHKPTHTHISMFQHNVEISKVQIQKFGISLLVRVFLYQQDSSPNNILGTEEPDCI